MTKEKEMIEMMKEKEMIQIAKEKERNDTNDEGEKRIQMMKAIERKKERKKEFK